MASKSLSGSELNSSSGVFFVVSIHFSINMLRLSSNKFDEDINHIKQIQFSVFSNDIITDYSSVNKDVNGINLVIAPVINN